MLTTILASTIAALVAGICTFAIQERRLKSEERRLSMKFQSDSKALQAVTRLLSTDGWALRGFDEIQKRLGGYEGDELRRILIAAGALKAEGKDGRELWGLISRNPELF